MNYVAANSASVTGVFTLDEGRAIFSSPFTHYLLSLTREDNGHDAADLKQVATVLIENTRYTKMTFSTLNLQAGSYKYEVYGQTSDTNTDITDESVVGLIERGLITLTATNDIFTNGDHTIAADRQAD